VIDHFRALVLGQSRVRLIQARARGIEIM